MAKYAPDVRRMEPRNIGVALWHGGQTAWRFLDEQDVPFVRDRENYVRWLDHWANKLRADNINDPVHGSVSREDPQFMDALRKTQQGQYLLYDGGVLLEEIETNELSAAADFLFHKFVQKVPTRIRAQAPATTLQTRCREFFEQMGLWSSHHFLHQSGGVPVTCHIEDKWKQLRFNYAIGQGTPSAVFQRVAQQNDQSWQSAAFRFQWLAEASPTIPQNRRAALHFGAPQNDEEAQNLNVLGTWATVVDISDFESAAQSVSKIVDMAI